jgi:hypothetical protein
VGYGTNKSELEIHAASITELFTTHLLRSLNEAVLKVKESTAGRKASITSFKRHQSKSQSPT